MPVYTYNGSECVSGGVVFCRRRDGGPTELLLLEREDRRQQELLEDPGGKSQSDDQCIEITAAREAAEELNAQVLSHDELARTTTYQERVDRCRDFIYALIRARPRCLINERNKYALFLVPWPFTDDRDFGTKEVHPKFVIERRARWVSTAQLLKRGVRAVHPRIRHLFNAL